MFEKELYYKYTKTLQTMNTVVYIVLIVIALLITLLSKNMTGLIITLPIAILIANNYTFKNKIKIQEMHWKLDMYNEIITKRGSN